MLNNLIAEMARKHINRSELAKLIGKSYNQTRARINGNSSFTIDEAILIQEKLFPDLDIKYLFENSQY